MKDIMVTIGVPVYNVGKYIEKCATSLLEQTYENLDLIFVNDCSQDDSVIILKEIIARYSQRSANVRIVNHGKNRGLSAARNTALEAAKGDFIMWVDGDDWLDRKTVEKAVLAQGRKNYDIVSFGFCKVFNKRNVNRPNPFFCSSKQMCEYLLWSGNHHVWGRLIRISLYKENNIRMKEGTNMGEDYQVMPILAYYSNSVATLNEYLYFYNCINENSYMKLGMSENSRLQLKESEEIVDAFFTDKGEAFVSAREKREVRKLIGRIFDNGRVNGQDMEMINALPQYPSYLPLNFAIVCKLKKIVLANFYVKLYRIISDFLKG